MSGKAEVCTSASLTPAWEWGRGGRKEKGNRGLLMSKGLAQGVTPGPGKKTWAKEEEVGYTGPPTPPLHPCPLLPQELYELPLRRGRCEASQDGLARASRNAAVRKPPGGREGLACRGRKAARQRDGDWAGQREGWINPRGLQVTWEAAGSGMRTMLRKAGKG